MMSDETDFWSAVLERAIDDLNIPEECDAAMRWFRNLKNDDIGSFSWICSVLGFDPDKTSARILHHQSLTKQGGAKLKVTGRRVVTYAEEGKNHGNNRRESNENIS